MRSIRAERARSATLNIMIRAADKAARGLKRDFGEVANLQVSRKGPADFVSAADLKSEQVLREELGRARPDYGFLMEESGSSPSKDSQGRRWIVDPLDGTTNFLHGLPHFAISIALADNKRILAGLVLDPVKNELFTAEAGSGAYLNDRRLRVSGRSRPEEALIATGTPFKGFGDVARFQGEAEAFMKETSGLRRWGAAALDLAYVAAGRYEGFWERALNPWDVAAGALLVQEAGGYVTDVEGRSFTLQSESVLACNDQLQPTILSMLAGRSLKS